MENGSWLTTGLLSMPAMVGDIAPQSNIANVSPVVRQMSGSTIIRLRHLFWLQSALLLCAVAGLGVLYVKATRPLYYPEDEALIRRTVANVAARSGASEKDILLISFPLVMHVSHRTCVELRPKRADLGGYLACYRRDNGQVVEERVSAAPFGSSRFFPPLFF